MTTEPHFRKILVPLLVIFLVCTTLLATVNTFTHGKIDRNARDRELRIIDSVMPLPHDNDLHEDYIKFEDPGIPGSAMMTVFRARQQGQPVAAVFMPVTAAGYSGTVLLVIGIAHDGTLLGVRVLKHHETPGLGDRIEQGKSGWINQFTGRYLTETTDAKWAVKADGGKFDQLSGATITSRGVVNAVRKALAFYQANRDRIYLEKR
jgi:electron transport complex protein RnfG